eukprot:3526279-Ditylum_brightwellii.AAC.1
MSLDIVNVYPSTKLLLIKKAIQHYARNLPTKSKLEIEQCLAMIAFGMKTTLVRFQDQYFNYNGVVGNEEEQNDEDNNGLAIGAFEAAFCTDMMGSYQDDELAIFDERRTVKQTVTWLHDFRLLVNEVVGGTYFQFTAEVWKPLEASEEPTLADELENDKMLPEEWKSWREKVKVIKKDAFPYFDMQMSWKNNNLHFL